MIEAVAPENGPARDERSGVHEVHPPPGRAKDIHRPSPRRAQNAYARDAESHLALPRQRSTRRSSSCPCGTSGTLGAIHDGPPRSSTRRLTRDETSAFGHADWAADAGTAVERARCTPSARASPVYSSRTRIAEARPGSPRLELEALYQRGGEINDAGGGLHDVRAWRTGRAGCFVSASVCGKATEAAASRRWLGNTGAPACDARAKAPTTDARHRLHRALEPASRRAAELMCTVCLGTLDPSGETPRRR